jgi:hypothetical protein
LRRPLSLPESAAVVRSEMSCRSFFRQSCIQVEHKGIGISTEVSNDEGDALGH